MTWKNGRPKPVIGIVGGIGSGKSSVARLFGREGCAVIDADKLSHDILQTPEVKLLMKQWLGETTAIFDAGGTIDRKALAGVVFSDPAKLNHLNGIIHPRVAHRRDELMATYLCDPGIKAVIWDSPLLLEAGLNRDCDAIVYVKVPMEIRQKRVEQSRGWTPDELLRRENSQIPLDKKASVADYCIDNSGDEAASLIQVHQVLSHLLSSRSP